MDYLSAFFAVVAWLAVLAQHLLARYYDARIRRDSERYRLLVDAASVFVERARMAGSAYAAFWSLQDWDSREEERRGAALPAPETDRAYREFADVRAQAVAAGLRLLALAQHDRASLEQDVDEVLVALQAGRRHEGTVNVNHLRDTVQVRTDEVVAWARTELGPPDLGVLRTGAPGDRFVLGLKVATGVWAAVVIAMLVAALRG